MIWCIISNTEQVCLKNGLVTDQQQKDHVCKRIGMLMISNKKNTSVNRTVWLMISNTLNQSAHRTVRFLHLHLSLNSGSRWSTTDDPTTIFFSPFFSVLHCPLRLSDLQACPFLDVVFPLLFLSAVRLMINDTKKKSLLTERLH